MHRPSMNLIGLLLNLAAITAVVCHHSEHGEHEVLTLSPSAHEVVRFTNQSLIVQCQSSLPDVKLHWKSPKGEVIKEHRGRIHIEQSSPEQLKIVFAHIALADKGNWTCEDVDGNKASKSFQLIVYQKITFTENTTMLTVKEGQNATILCEVKGEPQPNVSWSFNGKPIRIDTNTTKFRILGDGLLVNNVKQNDTGEYTCLAIQVDSIVSDMQTRTVLMKIEHKPNWTETHQHASLKYAYMNGSAKIYCSASAEPPANYTWYRHNKHLHNNKYYTIENENNMSILTIKALDKSVFGVYHCRAQNHYGSIERNTSLEKGEKPPTPKVLQLRGFNSNTFDIDVGLIKTSVIRTPMEINGYRFEYMTEHDFKLDAGKWTKAKSKDFAFEEGATFLIPNLEPNTTYYMRAASKNLAGLSDWTRVEKFRTLSNEPPSGATSPTHFSFQQIFLFSCILIISKSVLLPIFQPKMI